ncbi:hypothetical protein CROQUDRAFT_93831 [Cronartium quercuum f. sp. fusiforme G11]|uniref:Uncharacterized protein n=1 Tax=Cronartium quercuum f. sp. fusiforme G11 TaxID=708437 RepID=A0A9P6TAQ2_9BASI|nr:hypothetical protein CROQUDRAFT_93831 [Cronartium quercuum f. sp. fusiforme G11]
MLHLTQGLTQPLSAPPRSSVWSGSASLPSTRSPAGFSLPTPGLQADPSSSLVLACKIDQPLDGPDRTSNAPLSSLDLGADRQSCLMDSNAANPPATKKRKAPLKSFVPNCNIAPSSDGSQLECDPTHPATPHINPSLSTPPSNFNSSDTTSIPSILQHTKSQKMCLCNHLQKHHPSYILLTMDKQGILLGKSRNQYIHTQYAPCYDPDGELVFRQKNGEVFDYLSVFGY